MKHSSIYAAFTYNVHVQVFYYSVPTAALLTFHGGRKIVFLQIWWHVSLRERWHWRCWCSSLLCDITGGSSYKWQCTLSSPFSCMCCIRNGTPWRSLHTVAWLTLMLNFCIGLLIFATVVFFQLLLFVIFSYRSIAFTRSALSLLQNRVQLKRHVNAFLDR